MEYGPFNFETYDDEDYYFDGYGAYAQKYILGSDGVIRAAGNAVLNFRSDASEVARASGEDPEKSPDHFGTVPDDAPQPENIFGYQALLRIYGSEQAARIAAWAAAGYHREQAALAAGLLPEVPESPARPPPPDTIWDQPAEDDCTRRTGRRQTRNLTLPS